MLCYIAKGNGTNQMILTREEYMEDWRKSNVHYKGSSNVEKGGRRKCQSGGLQGLDLLLLDLSNEEGI